MFRFMHAFTISMLPTIHVMEKNVKVHDLDMGSCFALNSQNAISYKNFPFILMQKPILSQIGN
jgi:hypothetical protein